MPELSDIVVLDVPWDVLRRTLPPEALPHRPLIARLRTVLRRLSERVRPPLKPVTVMEAVTILQPSDERPTKDAFERCLTLAFEVIRSYRLSQRLMTRYPTVERLPFMIPYMVRTLAPPIEWEGPLMYLLHYNTPSSHQFRLPGPKEMDRLGFFFKAMQEGNPMITFSDQSLEAKIALRRDGDYSSAVTHAQTSLEALFDNLLTLMLWEEGVDPTRAAIEEFSLEMTLHRRVQRNYPNRLGGNWNPDGSGPIAKWRTKVVKLRNRVVHAGYIPSRKESEEAIEVSTEVFRFLTERLAGAVDRYPKSALLTIGLEGIGAYGSVSQELRDLAASDNGEWLRSYADWRNQLQQTAN